MFRSTTKHGNVRPTSIIRKMNKKVKENDNVLCDTLYGNTYSLPLPSVVYPVVCDIIQGLCGDGVEVSRDRREVHTIGLWVSNNLEMVRCFMLTPEVVTSTISASLEFVDSAYKAAEEFARTHNTVAPCTIVKYEHVFQCTGRAAPYIIDTIDTRGRNTLSSVNATCTRLIFSVTFEGKSKFYMLSRESLNILRQFAPSNTSMVPISATKCIKITTSPLDIPLARYNNKYTPNKNTCIMLQHDGNFKVQGRAQDIKRVCRALRQTIDAVAGSGSWYPFLLTLTSVSSEDPRM